MSNGKTKVEAGMGQAEASGSPHGSSPDSQSVGSHGDISVLNRNRECASGKETDRQINMSDDKYYCDCDSGICRNPHPYLLSDYYFKNF